MALIEDLSLFEIILFSFIILLILVYTYRIRLKFFLIRIFYGRYHYKYLRLFNRYFINRPYPDAVKDEPLDYVVSAYHAKPKIVLETNEEIRFVDYKIGETYNQFFKNNGDPDYLTISDPRLKQPRFIVAGYKAMVYDFEAMLVYFFIDNFLVMGQFRFRREKQPIEAQALINKLAERYQIKVDVSEDANFQVKDQQGHVINFRDNGFSVELNVLNPGNAMIKQVIQDQNYQPQKGIKDKTAKEEKVTF